MIKAKKFVMEKGYYEILEISPTATTIEIQRSFERLCDEHVDIKAVSNETRKKSAEILFALTKAYEILTDPFQRLSYDERRFTGKQPFNNEVETIFKEGLRAFRNSDIETAIRFYKEAVYLLPHKTTYRVHLAIAYHEKGWKEYAEKELRMALKLDPNSEFAQEVVARLLFKVSDKKQVGFFSQKANRQLAAVAAIAIVTMGVLVNGVPKAMAALEKVNLGNSTVASQKKSAELQKQLPAEMREAITKKAVEKASQPNQKVTIAKLDDSFKPEGKVYNYAEQVATKKTFYPAQNMVVVDYKNGSILTYKPQDLVGWKYDTETKTPVVITKANEVIPVPTDIPVTFSDGRTINPGEAGFPAEVFPEYKAQVNTETSKVAETVPVTTQEITSNSVVENNTPSNLPPVGGRPGA